MSSSAAAHPRARAWLTLALGLGVVALAGLAFWAQSRARTPAAAPLRLSAEATPAVPAGFARAFEPRAFDFPRDHGPHLDFQTEWWYYTGNLVTAAGDHVGYQLTFFRRGLAPGEPARESGLATHQVYFAHLAFTNSRAGEHTAFERFGRGAAGLAGATGEPFAVWIDDWQATALDAAGDRVRLQASQSGLGLDLVLAATKPIVAHGDAGLSPKSEIPGNASYYVSFTRLATTGTVTLGGEPLAVTGESWFDHEWSTSALGAGAVGWDWFSLQLSDGRELMYFQIRREDGTLEPASGGTLVEPDGRVVPVAASAITIDIENTWTSPRSGGVYPARWRVSVPALGLDLAIEPWVADQEMEVSVVYWEGAVRLTGTSGGAPITGRGYIELTGYATSIGGQF